MLKYFVKRPIILTNMSLLDLTVMSLDTCQPFQSNTHTVKPDLNGDSKIDNTKVLKQMVA